MTYRDPFEEFLARATRARNVCEVAQTDILTFSLGAGANVESQAAYASDPVQQNGYNTGIVPAAQISKVNRQGNLMAAALSQVMAAVLDAYVQDNGNFTAVIAQLWQTLLGSGFFLDSGSVNAVLLSNPAVPAGALTFTAPLPGTQFNVKILNTNTGSATLNWMGLTSYTTIPIVAGDGAALSGGEMIAGRIVSFIYDGANAQIVGPATTSEYGGNPIGVLSGGYLTVESTTSLQFARLNGTQVPISGVFQMIPGTPITVSNSGLAANTLYYVYVYMNAGTMTLALSTTGHVAGPNGYPVSGTNSGYTLLGMVRTNGSSQFVPISIGSGAGVSSTILCLNYYNQTLQPGYCSILNATSTSGSPVELNSSYRIQFLSWNVALVGTLMGEASNSAAPNSSSAAIGLDGSLWSPVAAAGTPTTNTQLCTTTAFGAVIVSEGYHQGEIFGSVNGGTGTFTEDLLMQVNG